MTIRTPEDEVTTAGHYYPPFREGWTYQGATYAGHSDWSVDWNRRTPTGGWLEDTGDPVLAAADGTVSEVDKGDGLVMVNHWGGLYRTEYRHMQNIVVKEGQKVDRSDRLGSIGNVAGDGRSFGAHLHHVHYRRDTTASPWKRVRMTFEGKPVGPSVESDDKPEGWKPPAAEFVMGPPTKATWESAYREAEKALTKTITRLDAQKAQLALAIEERDQARRDLTACQDQSTSGCDDEVRAARVEALDAAAAAIAAVPR